MHIHTVPLCSHRFHTSYYISRMTHRYNAYLQSFSLFTRMSNNMILAHNMERTIFWVSVLRCHWASRKLNCCYYNLLSFPFSLFTACYSYKAIVMVVPGSFIVIICRNERLNIHFMQGSINSWWPNWNELEKMLRNNNNKGVIRLSHYLLLGIIH